YCPFVAGGGFWAADQRDRARGPFRRRLVAPRHHGWSLRAEHLVWSRGGEADSPAHAAVFRHSSHVFETTNSAGTIRSGRGESDEYSRRTGRSGYAAFLENPVVRQKGRACH